MLGHPQSCEVKEAFAAGFGLASFETFPSFSEVLLYFPHIMDPLFYAAKMWYMGNTRWKVAYVYRILVTVCFCDLHTQVRTWAQSGEQLPLTYHITEPLIGI